MFLILIQRLMTRSRYYSSTVDSPDGPPATGWRVEASGKAPPPRSLDCVGTGSNSSAAVGPGRKWWYDKTKQHIVLDNPGGAELCVDTSGGNLSAWGPVKAYSCGPNECDNQRLEFWRNDSSVRWICGPHGTPTVPMCLWQGFYQNGSATVATMQTCAAAKLVTSPHGQWHWSAPATAAAAQPLVNVASGQCFGLVSASPSPSPPGPHPSPPPPDLSSPPANGDAVTTTTCTTDVVHGALRQQWAPCTGASCWPDGSPDAARRTNIFNNASGPGFAYKHGIGSTTGRLCLDSLGGAPGWAVRVWWCMTSNFNASAVWNPGGRFNRNQNMVTSSTWKLHSDGTLRTNISRVGSPTNASGEACLFAKMPSASADWAHSSSAVMWWCNGDPLSRWNLTDGRLVSAASGKCLTATSKRLVSSSGAPLGPTCHAPSPIPPPAITCRNCSSLPCSALPFCNASLSAQARAEDMVSRMSNQEKGYSLTDDMAVTRLTGVTLRHIDGLHGIDGAGCYDRHASVCWDRSDDPQCENEAWKGTKCVPKSRPYPNLTECRCATSFPSLVGVGATFNRSVFSSVGRVLSDEARAMHNMKLRQANLFFWTPDINLARNVLWGRNQE
jgi:hypothetical protein